MERAAHSLKGNGSPIDLLVEKIDPKMLQQLVVALGEIDYGAIEILIHNAKVVQIERRERFRANGNHLSA